MKVIKRDGRAVEYDRSKIQIAIEKANKEVKETEKASKEDINKIIKYIEELNKKRILVEDIQDIIEEKLMELKKYELAKKYIVYRYTRTLVRKQNTTDESILGIIRNNSERFNNSNTVITASIQRNHIASEVSKDLTKRLLLPEKIAKAEEEGILYFHSADYFVHPIFNSCIVNISDMLDNGTAINGVKIETPKSFQVACIILTQIIATVSANQCSEQVIDMNSLGKYLRKSYNKIKTEFEEMYTGKINKEILENLIQNRVKSELKSSIQMLQYQLNTLMEVNGKSNFVTLYLCLKEDDEYIYENALIIEEILKQRYEGIKDEKNNLTTPNFPKLIYVLDECNSLRGRKYDYLTELAMKCTYKRKYPNYISAKKMRENYDGNVLCPMGDEGYLSLWKNEEGIYKFDGRFNQGIVTLNLPQIAIISNRDEKKFWSLLKERLELCYEALMCRHYALVGINSNISPIHWKHGAVARVEDGAKIDKLLYGGYSTISLGYIGIYEMTKLMKGISHTDVVGYRFALKVLNYLKEVTDKWTKDINIKFVLCGISSSKILRNFAQIDKRKFGIIKEITDKGYYTSAYNVYEKEKMDLFKRLLFEAEFQKISIGGGSSYINLKEHKIDKDLIKFIYENVQYAEFK